ncbi:hypothetical protein SAMN05443377_1056 [Propionibacterium cyclohexanicum]|uniref:Uncharacterized protein n=2 Tax=Propionibacterium cyclohexanicum TaxID=64702 RepID=A0A1H9QXY2_9ACTN|nr:hypothetical protein SAMN05443377_1056 [Propionibacterium cyclohexanicum]
MVWQLPAEQTEAMTIAPAEFSNGHPNHPHPAPRGPHGPVDRSTSCPRGPAAESGPPQQCGPALPPVLRVNADIVAIGPHRLWLKARHAQPVELSGAGVPRLRRLLLLMDGRHGTEWLLAGLTRQDRAAMAELLNHLLTAGVLCTGSKMVRPRRTVSVIGSGELARLLGLRLAQIAHVACYDDATPGGHIEFHPPGWRFGHWTQAIDRPGDLIVWAPGGQAPDPAVGFALVGAALPHLVVTAHRLRAQVSPLVVPGITACVECQRSHDQWPREVAERCALILRPARPARETAGWAVEMAQAMVLSHLRSGRATRGADTTGAVLRPTPPDRRCGACSRLLARRQPELAA